MDKQSLALLIPILALAIPVVAIVMTSMVKIARFRAQAQVTLPPEVEQRIGALEEDVGSLRQELAETHERLDFAERLLAQRSEAPRIDGQTGRRADG
jgi:hypothetical protein